MKTYVFFQLLNLLHLFFSNVYRFGKKSFIRYIALVRAILVYVLSNAYWSLALLLRSFVRHIC